ncbi:MAG: septal ring lytic transglycosylase RlpA family protein [Bacteroidetes bacterium]|nr:septal ring lytic transglycosylase RlpA family protein [Bacteroidota bacterium]MCL5738086.1 septal ring lytic transglycosylase RlpA family protein [Bacteroidota bacterium]
MRKAFLIAMVASALYLAGCSAAARFTNTGSSTTQPSFNTSTEKPLLTVEGIASYYSYGFDGKKTASGEIFNKNSLTAAHREFPFGTLLRVTNLGNGKSVEVVVNDRGPFDKSRIIDLSEAAAREIDMIQDGTAKVKIEVLKWGTSQTGNGD